MFNDDFGRIFIIPSDQAYQAADARDSGDTEWGFKFGEHAGTFVGNSYHGWNIIPSKSSGRAGGYPLLVGPDALSTPQGRAAIAGQPTAWDQVAPPDFLDIHFVARSLDETGKLVPININDRATARIEWIKRLQTHRLWDPNKSKLPVTQREGSGTKEDPYRIVSYPTGHPDIIPGSELGPDEVPPWVKIPTDWREQHAIPFVASSVSPCASDFEFHYTTMLGHIGTHTYCLDKKSEGFMLFFPASLQHTVYPFYNCDKERISISGNIRLDTSTSNL